MIEVAAEVQMVPGRSIEQRMVALGEANRIRSYRARLKRDVRARRVTVRDLLAAPPAELETMKVFELLLVAPKVGRVKANKMLLSVRVSPSKTVGGLTGRQREALLALLAGVGVRSR